MRNLRYNSDTSMIHGRIGCELVMLTVICILTIFLFPAMQGPYSAVNGPVTALQASRAAFRLRRLILQCALRRFGYFSMATGVFSWTWLGQTEPHAGFSRDGATILRC